MFARGAASRRCPGKAGGLAGFESKRLHGNRENQSSGGPGWYPEASPSRRAGARRGGSPAAQAQAPAHLLTQAASDQGSSLLRFCFVDGTDAKGHLRTQGTHTHTGLVRAGATGLPRQSTLSSVRAPAVSTASRCPSPADQS